MIIRVTWKYQPTKWVDDALGGCHRPDGKVIEKIGVVAGYLNTNSGVKAVVVATPEDGENYFEEVPLSDLSIWRLQ